MMNNVDYKLQSNIDQIAKCIKDSNYCLASEAKEEAEYILRYCPKELYKNIDEIVNNEKISDIKYFLITNDKQMKITINEIYQDFYKKIPYIIIILGICKELNNNYGFLWLHDLLQLG